MSTRTKKFALFSIVLLGLSFLGGYACFSVVQGIREKRESIDMTLAQEAVNVEKMKQQDELSRQYAFVQERERALTEVFIRKEDMVSVIQRLEALAQDSGVVVKLNIQEGGTVKQVVKASPQTGVKDTRTDQEKKDQAEEDKKKILFLLEIRGTYEKTLVYMDRLERIQPIASFESVSMQKDDSEERSVASGIGEADDESEAKEKTIVTNLSLSFIQQ